ncbi:hypothetical protein ACSQ67_008667 [Phaseolus vulgaris]
MSGAKHERNHGGEQEWCGYMKGEDVSYGDASDKDLRLRLLAESKGFRLDDTGLFPATHGSGSKRGAKGSASLKFNTEKEVFDFLDFPWLEPHERNL